LISLTDTHCHLYLPQFDNDRDDVIKKAIDAGISKILVPGIDIKTSEQAINLCAIYPTVLYAAIGIHPNSKNNFNEKSIEQLKSLAKSDHVVAIGEIGLDYYQLENTPDYQKAIFQSQLDVSSELNLPVCIHNRNASEDVIEIVKKWQVSHREENNQNFPTGVFHSFAGSFEVANEIINLGFYLGITGPITYSKNHEFRSIIKMIPFDRILIETDSPYLTPHPFRGQRNQPVYVKYIAQALSDIYQMDLESIEIFTSKNANDIFHWE